MFLMSFATESRDVQLLSVHFGVKGQVRWSSKQVIYCYLWDEKPAQALGCTFYRERRAGEEVAL